MTTWRYRGLAVTAVLLVATGVRCYKPNIQDGGLLCAEGGTPCPDGFQCRDGKCHSGPAPVCQGGSRHIDPICTPLAGSPCDPICQSGCPCGRCSLVGTGPMCTPPAGTKMTGAVCNAVADDCLPGNVCLKDCGGQVARCFRFCGNGNVSDESECHGQSCDVPVNNAVDGGATNLTVCEPPTTTCNPVGDSGDCGSAALGCYVTSAGETACDCKGTSQPGMSCDGPYNSCIAGYRCIQIGTDKCFQTCTIGGTDCTPPQVCTAAPGSPTYGYCANP